MVIATAFVARIASADVFEIQDALGKPIPHAAVEVLPDDPEAMIEQRGETGEHGEINTVDFRLLEHATVKISHRDYGVGLVPVNQIRSSRVRAPLMKRNSREAERALRGQVCDPDGTPVAGATIRGLIRTPGEGLVGEAQVMTDDRGEFQMYVPEKDDEDEIFNRFPLRANDQPKERGKLIPPHSVYHVRVDAPFSEGLFPKYQDCSNDAEAKIDLLRPTLRRKFIFVDTNGVELKPDKLRGASVTYVPAGEGYRVELSAQYLEKVGKVLPGKYEARTDDDLFDSATVTKDGGEVVEFKVRPSIVYRGKVLDGPTGKSATRAFVILQNGTKTRTLVDLSHEEWRTLHGLAEHPESDDDHLAPLIACYKFQDIARTDAEGNYELKSIPGKETYEILTFDEDCLPFARRLYDLKRDDNTVQVQPMYLAPAAKIKLKPVTGPAQSVGFWPGWKVDGNPAPVEVGAGRYLQSGETGVTYVPASVPIRLILHAPYDDAWVTHIDEKPVVLQKGQVQDRGDVHFAATIKANIRVVDFRGEALEGAPLRRFDPVTNCYSVVHNTDADGSATFLVAPNATVKFSCAAGASGLNDAERAAGEIEVKTGSEAVSAPLGTITLSEHLAEKIFKPQR